MVDRHRSRVARGELQFPLGDHDVRVRRRDVNLIDFDDLIAADLADRHRRAPRQDLREHADVLRLLMLNEHKGHTGMGGECAQQIGERFEAAGGRADSDDREL